MAGRAWLFGDQLFGVFNDLNVQLLVPDWSREWQAQSSAQLSHFYICRAKVPLSGQA